MMADPEAKFSVLIIGCGAIAGGYDAQDIAGENILTHAKAFNIHQGFELVGCLDMDQEIAQNFAGTWQVDRAYTSLDQALGDRDFDIISLCTSTPSHENILRHLQGYDFRLIFCEKPLTDNLDTARQMAACYPDNMAVNYLRRFDPDIRQLARDLEKGRYGRFLYGKTKYNKGLYNNGSHMTDLLNMLIGPVKVTAADGIIYDFWPDDPTLSARLETETGRPIDLIGSDVRNGTIFDLELTFNKAKIILTDYSHTLIIQPNEGPESQIQTGLNQGMLHAVSNIYDHLTLGADLYSKAENAVLALEVCSEIRKQAQLS